MTPEKAASLLAEPLDDHESDPWHGDHLAKTACFPDELLVGDALPRSCRRENLAFQTHVIEGTFVPGGIGQTVLNDEVVDPDHIGVAQRIAQLIREG